MKNKVTKKNKRNLRHHTLKKQVGGDLIDDIQVNLKHLFTGGHNHYRFPENKFPNESELTDVLAHVLPIMNTQIEDNKQITGKDILDSYAPIKSESQKDDVFGYEVDVKFQLTPYVQKRATKYIRINRKCGEKSWFDKSYGDRYQPCKEIGLYTYIADNCVLIKGILASFLINNWPKFCFTSSPTLNCL